MSRTQPQIRPQSFTPPATLETRAAPLETRTEIDDADDEPDAGIAGLTKAVDKLTKAAAEKQATLEKRIQKMEDEEAMRLNRRRLAGDPVSTSLSVGENSEGAEAEHRALAIFARTGDDAELRSVTLAVGNDSGGGYMVQPVRSQTMTQRLRDLSPIRRLARVETVTIGDAWEEPLDLGESSAAWVAEREQRPATDTPDLAMLTVAIHELYALQTVTQRLLDDAGFDLGSWLDGKINDKFGRTEGEAYVVGDGVRKPKGLLAYDTSLAADAQRPWGIFQHLVTGSSDSLGGGIADLLRDLTWALRTPYRQGSVWLMNSGTASLIDKLKDGQGNYLWRDSATAGAPPTLLGYPVEIDESMPNVAAGSRPIAFGNLRLAYLIVEKPGLKALRDPYTDKPNVLFYAYRRVGGGANNTEAMKFIQVAAS